VSRVVLAMSGGVDSSVAAHLLCEAGHEVIGVFMRHGERVETACDVPPGDALLPVVSNTKSHKQGCCSAEDAEDGRRVADRLGIPFYALNLEEDFARIIDYFVEEYSAARTPNPCVVCNIWLKFGKLFEYADSVGAEYVATGHYAQLAPPESSGELPALLRGVDEDKDQSYVLFGVEPERLRRMLLPVGSYRKPEIRRMATEIGLRVAEKKDSQEICFVASGEHPEFVRQRRGTRDTAGEIVTTAGDVVGQHDGFESFTVGQRKGLAVAMGEPRYVVRIERESRRVVIGEREELARSELTAQRTNWLIDLPHAPRRCEVMIRYNSTAHPAMVETLPDARLSIKFDSPQYGIAPGQAVVCYDGPRVLGGGWIE
jgi:tRNA-specific 2-thiouridylase